MRHRRQGRGARRRGGGLRLRRGRLGGLIAPDPKLLRDACRLAVEVARDGELAEPRLPAPSGLRTVLGFSRLSAAAYAIIRRAIDEDEAFRGRVAAAASEAEVGRAGWLWLQRPIGWEDDPSLAVAVDDHDHGRGQARLRRERDGAEAAAARWKERAEAAEAARSRVEVQLADAMATGRAEAAADHAADRARLGEERNAAVREQKRLEAELAATRRDLKAARSALVAAEADLAAARRATSPPSGDREAPSAVPVPAVPTAPGGPAAAARPAPADGSDRSEPFDRRAARDAVGAAARAAADLSAALAGVAEALAAPGAGDDGSDGRWPPPDATPVGARRARRGAPRSARSGERARPEHRRAQPPLPPGAFAGSAEADRHLVASGQAVLVVDGYNLARSAWQGLAPEEERRRTVALLEEVRARSGGDVTVVFDGQDDAVAPTASRSIRVRFSASGTTADDAIAALLGLLPAHQPVVVVSSDGEVADDARRQGAAVLSSAAFLAAAGR
ncbi:NYN domain-containing protein [Aquihabitans sp. G128]|uniref:NYN domain-containing protein n=1 Tax=Aquihabitans sp. G128 TaxID=2849779 RepID=UPI001C245F84|nr:NYN domain-containing protein [Aquihabitans sp. G128]QXC62313.1 NYN domain-containing protein [Aquihabitans sp. G128]